MKWKTGYKHSRFYFDKNLFNYKDKYDNYYDSLNLVPKNTDKIILQDHLKKITNKAEMPIIPCGCPMEGTSFCISTF